MQPHIEGSAVLQHHEPDGGAEGSLDATWLWRDSYQVQDGEQLASQGMRASVDAVRGHVQCNGRSGRDDVSAATSSTERVAYVPSPPRRETAECGYPAC